MEYMRLILEMFWDLQEKGFMPEGVNYERFMEDGFEPSGAASDRCFEIIKERLG